jgi:hypothetical protein
LLKEVAFLAGILTMMILCSTVVLAEEAQPQTGTFIEKSNMSGMGELEIINNGPDDAVAVLSETEKGIVAAVYIRGNEIFNLTGIEDGSYELYFKQGESWNSSIANFDINASLSRMEALLTYKAVKTDSGISYQVGQVTIEEVTDGDTAKVPVSETEFPRLK